MEFGSIMGLATVLAFSAFVSVCVWVYSGKRASDFEEAANLPFADDDRHSTDSIRRMDS